MELSRDPETLTLENVVRPDKDHVNVDFVMRWNNGKALLNGARVNATRGEPEAYTRMRRLNNDVTAHRIDLDTALRQSRLHDVAGFISGLRMAIKNVAYGDAPAKSRWGMLLPWAMYGHSGHSLEMAYNGVA